jgi:8-oxo-dGTP diphosphatase
VQPVSVVLSVDVACFALDGGEVRLLLVRRAAEPFAGWWALPGGAAQGAESLDHTAGRVLAERTELTGAALGDAYLEQLYTFGDPGRDPRGRTVSVAYYAILPATVPLPRRGRQVSDLTWAPLEGLPPLAFDHARIAAYARWRLAQKLEYSPLAFRLLPERFTMADLRRLHETLQGHPLDPSNFARQMLARWDLAPVPGERDRRRGRPARLFRYIGPPHVPGPPPGDTPPAPPAEGPSRP